MCLFIASHKIIGAKDKIKEWWMEQRCENKTNVPTNLGLLNGE